jgi:hypothetical protein
MDPMQNGPGEVNFCPCCGTNIRNVALALRFIPPAKPTKLVIEETASKPKPKSKKIVRTIVPQDVIDKIIQFRKEKVSLPQMAVNLNLPLGVISYIVYQKLKSVPVSHPTKKVTRG